SPNDYQPSLCLRKRPRNQNIVRRRGNSARVHQVVWKAVANQVGLTPTLGIDALRRGKHRPHARRQSCDDRTKRDNGSTPDEALLHTAITVFITGGGPVIANI